MRSELSWGARFRRVALVAALAAAGAASVRLFSSFAAELPGPQARDRQVALIVASQMRQQHISRRPLDDEIARRGLDLYLRSLDPLKLYFLQSDVEEFSQERDQLDDQVKKGDIQFAYKVHERFLQRVDERLATIDELLQEPQDFTLQEEIVVDREMLQYPQDAAEARERWRQRLKYDLLVLQADEVEGQAALDKLTRRYHSLAKRMHQTDGDEILEMYLTAITSGFDPHTTYMSPGSLENFRIQMSLNLEGIGAALQSIDGSTTVSKVIPGGAAAKEGSLKPEDRIVSVGQGPEGEMVDVQDLKLNDVVKLIRGKAGTVVRLGVVPAGATETRIISITRAQIELADEEARGVVFEEGEKPSGGPYKIGVINLPSFYMDMSGARRDVADYKSTTRDVRRILEDFRRQGVDAVVLDLRNNGGGALSEAIDLTGLFIDQGPVVQVKDAAGRIQSYPDLDRGVAWDGPLVVLTSKLSASASEILAGAIQDYHRGLIVGDQATHGKGTVQSLLDLGEQLFRGLPEPPNYGALKVTMQQFYRPNGDSTQKRGVLADVILPSLTTHMDVAEGDLDYAMDFDRVPAAEFDALDLVSPPLLERLRGESAARMSASEEFGALLTRIDRYREQKERKTAPLNAEEFFARRAELDAEEEEQKTFEGQNNPSDEVVVKDFYFNEVLAITLDYIRELDAQKVAARE